MKLVSFSNKRPVTEQGSFLSASQTEGKIRLTKVVADAMGVIEGDYVAVGKDAETGKIYVYAGVKDENNQVGNKLSSTGQNFEFGSKNAWEEIEGTKDHSVRYTVAEEPLVVGEGAEAMKFFELTDKEDLPRSTRTKKDGSVKDADDDSEDEEDGGDVAPEVEAEEAGFSLD